MSHRNNDTQKVGTDLLKSEAKKPGVKWKDYQSWQSRAFKQEVPSVITSVTAEEEEKKPAK